MSTTKLPPNLVRRLKKAVVYGDGRGEFGRVDTEGFLLGLEKVDPRPSQSFAGVESLDEPGERIRELNVGNKHPEIGMLALKKVHTYPSQQTIDVLQKAVEIHNQTHHSDNYDLIFPQASALSEELVAMKKAQFTVDEQLVDRLKNTPIADLELLAFDTLSPSRTQSILEVLETVGFNRERLVQISNEIRGKVVLEGLGPQNQCLDNSNLLVVGVKKGKLQLVPAIDIF